MGTQDKIGRPLNSEPPANRETLTTGADLPPYLAAGRQIRVHICIGGTRANGGDDLVEFARRKLLASCCPRYDVFLRDRPFYGTLLRALRGKTGRINEWRRPCGRLTQPDDDATVHAELSNMNVSLLHRSLETAVCQLV